MDVLLQKAAGIMAQNLGVGSYCTIALKDFDGSPTASTITPAQTKGLTDVYFCTGIESDKVKRIEQDKRGSVCFNSDEHNVSLVGTFEVLTDPKIKADMWYAGLENHFTGPEDPDYCVLHFKAAKYNLLVDWQEVKGDL